MISLNLRKQAPWLQLIIFGLITMVLALLCTGVGAYWVALANHVPLSRLAGFTAADYAKPEFAGIERGLLVVQFFGIFLLPSLAFAALADPRPLHFCGLKKPDFSSALILAMVAMMSAFFMLEWLSLLNEKLVQNLFGQAAQRWIREGEDERNATLQNILNMKTPLDLLVSILMIGLMAAIGEELFFRGILQRIFIQALRNPWAGILVTAAIFSAIHGQFMGFIPRWILGAVLGALYWYSGSLYAPIAGHFVFNAMQVVLVYFRLVDPHQTSTGGGTMLALAGVPALAVVILILRFMRKKSVNSYERVYGEPKVFDQTL